MTVSESQTVGAEDLRQSVHPGQHVVRRRSGQRGRQSRWYHPPPSADSAKARLDCYLAPSWQEIERQQVNKVFVAHVFVQSNPGFLPLQELAVSRNERARPLMQLGT